MISHPAIYVLTIALYAVVGALLWRRLLAGAVAHGGVRLGVLALAAGAVVLHAAILYANLRAVAGLNLAFTNAASLVAWVVAALFLLASLSRPILNLGIVVMPIAGLTVLVEWLWPGERLLPPDALGLQAAHIAISILAYSLLSLAAVQGLLLLVQERALRARHAAGFVRALPPLETMEALLFQLIGAGFLLLSLTLVSGIFFSEEVFGKPLKLTHHILLSVFAWLVFATLLLGRRRFGWRGRNAVRWTLGGFSLLLLAYFGSKFVLEVLLGR